MTKYIASQLDTSPLPIVTSQGGRESFSSEGMKVRSEETDRRPDGLKEFLSLSLSLYLSLSLSISLSLSLFPLPLSAYLSDSWQPLHTGDKRKAEEETDSVPLLFCT